MEQAEERIARLRKELSSPICLDIQLVSREEYRLALWLLRFPRFYCKAKKCVVRIVWLSPYQATLEVLKF
jgi:hypothetical protein